MISLASRFRLALMRRGLFTYFVVCVSVALTSVVAVIALLLFPISPQWVNAFVHRPRDEAQALQMAQAVATFELPNGYRIDEAWQTGFYADAFTNVEIVPKSATRRFKIRMFGMWAPISAPIDSYLSPESEASSFAARFRKNRPQCRLKVVGIEAININKVPVRLAVLSCENRGHPIKAEVGQIPGNDAVAEIYAFGDARYGFDHDALMHLLHSIR